MIDGAPHADADARAPGCLRNRLRNRGVCVSVCVCVCVVCVVCVWVYCMSHRHCRRRGAHTHACTHSFTHTLSRAKRSPSHVPWIWRRCAHQRYPHSGRITSMMSRLRCNGDLVGYGEICNWRCRVSENKVQKKKIIALGCRAILINRRRWIP